MRSIYYILSISLIFSLESCYQSPERIPNIEKEIVFYESLYDQFKDEGQYWLPSPSKSPLRYWNCVEVVGVPTRNDIHQTELIRGLQYHLLAQSVQGLSQLAVEEGRGTVSVWLTDHTNSDSYKNSKAALGDMGISEIGMQSAIELANNNYGEAERLKLLWKGDDDKFGYVLTDVVNNPESATVATVAAHVHNAVIIDVRDREYYENQGYTMRYDAREKSTSDAWREFKDRCNNNALILRSVQSGELSSYAITNKLFVINLNKEQANPSAGQNDQLLDEILAWLEPNSPVIGWEQGVEEKEFVEHVTKSGNILVTYDWAYNTDLTSLSYKNRQKERVYVNNPQFYDYDDTKSFVSFFLSDGDNAMWMMTDFGSSKYYTHPDVAETRFSFGMPIGNLSMIAPSQLDNLLNMQKRESSIIESLGGGYYYIDQFGETANRQSVLKKQSEMIAKHMRQRNSKLLNVIAMDCKSEAAKEAYQAYIEANNQLEGIIAIQYAPYAGGEGEIYWFKNSDGYDIPVVTVRYSIWNFGDRNDTSQGTPAFVASKLNANGEQTFSAVCVHSWSRFKDIGESDDLLAENDNNGDIIGAGAAKQCVKRLDESIRVVNMQELVWQLRMKYHPDETKKYLSEVF